MAAANPVIVEVLNGVWTLVALAATLGYIYPKDGDIVYYHTYKLAGETAPGDDPGPDDDTFIGVPVYYRSERIAGQNVIVGGVVMGGSTPLDHYIYADGGDGKVIVQRGN